MCDVPRVGRVLVLGSSAGYTERADSMSCDGTSVGETKSGGVAQDHSEGGGSDADGCVDDIVEEAADYSVGAIAKSRGT